jgi:mono/diheme cytochrome c family protein
MIRHAADVRCVSTREEAMRLSHLATLVGVAASAATAVAAPAPQAAPGPATPAPGSAVAVVSGSYSFRTYCASCHGIDAKGDGPLAESLRFHPPDLTQIAKRNGGEFPAEKLAQIVDGRKPLKGHGGAEMPVWGDAFRNSETGYDEESVKARIRSVVDYLKTIQVP